MTTKFQLGILAIIMVVIAAVYFLAPVVLPFVLGAMLAYIINPIVNFCERLNISRSFAIALIILIGLAIILLLFGLLIPLLEKQIWLLANAIPKLFTWLQLKTHLPLDSVAIKQIIFAHLQTSGSVAKHILLALMSSTKLIIETVINLILIPVVAIYLLRDWKKITGNFSALLPNHNREQIIAIINNCGEVLAAFFRGQLLVMMILGVFYSIALTIIGLDFSLLIGMSVGVLSLIPYLGFSIGFIISMADVIVHYHSVVHSSYTIVTFIVGHVIESYILQPWLIGHRIGLHPVAVIFALLAGGVLFGFIGVLLALPAAAVIMVLLRYGHRYYICSNYYNGHF